jgi:hypothetical protein
MHKKILIWLQKRFKAAKAESGQTMVIVLIMLLLGGLIIAPLLAFMGTGLKNGIIFETKTKELYAADSGIEDGMWQINYDDLEVLDTPSAYDFYDYNTVWNYQLADQVNAKDVDVTIKNVWIPKGIAIPDKNEARDIIETGKLIVTGTVPSAATYQIKIAYYGCVGEDLRVQKIGVWLPPGFDYVEGSSNLEADPFFSYYSVPTTEPHQGGTAVIWSFSNVPYDEFPYVESDAPEGTPKNTEVTFEFDGPSGQNPSAISWIKTSGAADIPYAWDADTQIYKITSQAGDTDLESYTAKNKLRALGSSISGDYYAIGNSLLTPTGDINYRDRLYKENNATLATSTNPEEGIPAAATVEAAYLYWSGWIDWIGYEPTAGGDTILFYDDCANFSDWNNPGSDWVIYSGRFRGHHLGNDPDRYLPMQDSLDLSVYSGKTVTVSWNQSEQGYLEDSDRLYFSFSGDGGSSWSSDIEAFRDDDPPSSFSYQIPQAYLTANFKMRFYLYYFEGYGEYCYIDDITISVSDALLSDECSSFTNWDNESDWTISSGAFSAHHISGGGRNLTLSSSLDLSSYSSLAVSWQQWNGGTLESSDCLRFAFSGDGGSSWSSYTDAFCGNIGGSPQDFSYTIPTQYLTNNFKMRFSINSFDGWGEYCYLDNIVISESAGTDGLKYPTNPTNETLTVLVEETARVNTVMFNDVQITTHDWLVKETEGGVWDRQWSYRCFYDATDLVEQWIEDESIDPNGAGTYTVGHVLATNQKDPDYSFDLYPSGETGYPLATPALPSHPTRHQYTFCGWSLIIIYSSYATQGHQLYLFDDNLIEGWHDDPDFDDDGEPGGSISGFLVPEQIEGDPDPNAARLTVFTGEGDSGMTGDYIKVNNHSLSNSASPMNNVWNSASPGLAIPGVDIDTFNVTWVSGILAPGDSQADINLPTTDDGFLIIYIILSFRSDITSGGTLGYLIRG